MRKRVLVIETGGVTDIVGGFGVIGGPLIARLPI